MDKLQNMKNEKRRALNDIHYGKKDLDFLRLASLQNIFFLGL